MKITVNGEEWEFDGPLSLEALIEALKIADKVMAAAVNMEIVKKDQWHEHRLNDGDRVELLHFVSGG